MQAFTTWRRKRHRSDLAPGRSFEGREFEDELPGQYAPPHGRLLIAYEADQPAGCAALCDLGSGVCEAEQIFVADLFRGQRIGRALVERLLLEAKSAGYRRMRLGTSLREDEAMRLCGHAGFQQIGSDQEDHAPAHPIGSSPVLFERDLRIAL
jgi:GNAT superfamily N-acetyltransferase